MYVIHEYYAFYYKDKILQISLQKTKTLFLNLVARYQNIDTFLKSSWIFSSTKSQTIVIVVNTS